MTFSSSAADSGRSRRPAALAALGRAAVLAAVLAVPLSAGAAPAAPMRIDAHAPASARPGDTVTLSGSFPESRPAGLRVRYGAGGEALGETSLPVVWTDTQITVQLPTDLPPGTYWLGLYEGDAPVSNRSGPLEITPRSTFPVLPADDAADPAERLARLPRGIEIPDGQIEALRTLPYIMRFEASVPDCPAEPFPRDFLSYRVTNNVRRVTIDAVYADGRTRRFHDETLAEPQAVLEATGISDPGISRGQVAYRLEATGGEGAVARKDLAFRVAEPVQVALASDFREVGGAAGAASAREAGGPAGGVRYEADVEVSNAAAIRTITLEGKSSSGETVITLRGELRNGKIVSAPRPPAPVEGATPAVARFLLHIRAEDPCTGPTTIDRQAALTPR